MPKKHYELMVIGGGTAGLRTALYAANHGHRTVLIEPAKLGGTCLHTGCIPTKAMLHASALYSSAKRLKQFGIYAKPKLNFGALMSRVKKILREGERHISETVGSRNLTVIKADASFTGEKTVIAGKKTITASRIIIAAGSKNLLVPIKGLDKVRFLDNESVIALKSLPKSVAMIGGGYIAMEFATFFSGLGSKVTIMERSPQILGMLDADVAELLEQYYTMNGVKLMTGVEIEEVAGSGKLKKITCSRLDDPSRKKMAVFAEQVVVAVGRVPEISRLNCAAAGIKIGKKGDIEVNSFLQTTAPDIYAIGDVTGKAMFAHAAKRESHIALRNALDGKKEEMNFSLVPWAVFTDPPVAGVGLSEKAARAMCAEMSAAEAKCTDIGILKASFKRAGRARIIDDTRGFVKVIYNRHGGKILGAVIIGPRADDLIHEFAAIMNSSSPTVDTIRNTIHVHPTISEVMEALKDA